MRKFYETTFKFQVLSEAPIPEGMELADVMRETIEGNYVADEEERTETILTPLEAVTRLYAFGSEPGFFSLDDEGGDSDT